MSLAGWVLIHLIELAVFLVIVREGRRDRARLAHPMFMPYWQNEIASLTAWIVLPFSVVSFVVGCLHPEWRVLIWR